VIILAGLQLVFIVLVVTDEITYLGSDIQLQLNLSVVLFFPKEGREANEWQVP